MNNETIHPADPVTEPRLSVSFYKKNETPPDIEESVVGIVDSLSIRLRKNVMQSICESLTRSDRKSPTEYMSIIAAWRRFGREIHPFFTTDRQHLTDVVRIVQGAAAILHLRVQGSAVRAELEDDSTRSDTTHQFARDIQEALGRAPGIKILTMQDEIVGELRADILYACDAYLSHDGPAKGQKEIHTLLSTWKLFVDTVRQATESGRSDTVTQCLTEVAKQLKEYSNTGKYSMKPT